MPSDANWFLHNAHPRPTNALRTFHKESNKEKIRKSRPPNCIITPSAPAVPDLIQPTLRRLMLRVRIYEDAGSTLPICIRGEVRC